MTSEEFVDIIKVYVRDAAIADTLANLSAPPGRSPDRKALDLLQWFKNLPKKDVMHISQVITHAVGQALFGMLVTLDGGRVVD